MNADKKRTRYAGSEPIAYPIPILICGNPCSSVSCVGPSPCFPSAFICVHLRFQLFFLLQAGAIRFMDSSATQEVTRLRDLSPQQVKSGLAAWLGWLFDGL